MIGRYRRELSVAAAYVALLGILAVAAPRFFLPEPLRALVVSNASVLVAAVGMTLVILCRQIDISIGSIFGVFVAMGALAGLAALLNAVRFADVDPNAGAGLELQVIAAVVVGGVAISGGRGTLLGSLVGVALLGSIGRALVFLQVTAQWEK